jgi:hypothetical protein
MDSSLGDLALARASLKRLKARLAAQGVEAYAGRASDRRDWPQRYSAVPEEIAAANARLEKDHPAAVADYNRGVLLELIASFSLNDAIYSLPPSITALYGREISRILHQIDSAEDGFFAIANDGFLKDLAILSHRLIPIGAEYAQGEAGIPRSLLFSVGPKQFFKLLWLIVVRCGGRQPFFALHAHTLALDDFNPEGWIASYHRLADLLELNPEVRGWMSASWFLDPALESISPRLAHLRKVPLENGAGLLFVCRHPDGRSGALSKSPTRRRLFADGCYVPATYMRVWPRKAVIAWSRRTR